MFVLHYSSKLYVHKTAQFLLIHSLIEIIQIKYIFTFYIYIYIYIYLFFDSLILFIRWKIKSKQKNVKLTVGLYIVRIYI